MRIVLLTAGAGGMYCGSCLHANTLAVALRSAGEDALLVPLYTPLRTDEENVSSPRVAYGGINVYLQQRWALFRRTPWLLDWLLDRPALLRWAGNRGTATRPESLGETTVSVLRGEEGRQHKELDKLARWLKQEVRPDLIHLGNVLLCGVARELTRRLGVPVVCSLSGEDAFLERLAEPHYSQARTALRERSGDLAALAAMNHYYADFMAEYLALPRERIEVIPPGLNLAGHAPPSSQRPAPATDAAAPAAVTIGYLARVCPEKGLHLLAEAFRLLCEDPDLPALRLRAAGYLDQADRPYLKQIEVRLAEWGLAERFAYLGELDRAGKIAFLQSLFVLSVPTVYRESKGLSVLEGWANAVPAVLPAHGTFPELIADTGGGLLCEPNDPAALAELLKRLIQQPDFAAECGRRAQQIIHQRYTAEVMAQRTIRWYRNVCGRW
jgi:glycosyltransferase involved in cell wall biosynthesis